MPLEPTLLAVFLTGLLGGVHCAGMCGGIVGAIGLAGERPRARPSGGLRPGALPARRTTLAADGPAGGGVAIAMPPPGSRAAPGAPLASAVAPRLARLLPYNAGRLASYTALGAAAGAAGSFGWLLGDALPLQQLAFGATSVLLILMGLYVAGVRRAGHALEGIGRGAWARVRPFASASLARAGSMPGAFVAGGLWGLVPCGMVYAVLIAALLGGSAAHGAALMLAFGLGTLPNLLLLGLSGSFLARLTRRPGVRLAFGLGIALFGVLGLLRLDAAASLPIIGELCTRLPGIGA